MNPRAGEKPQAERPRAAAPQAHPDERPVRIVGLTRETDDATTVTIANVDGSPIAHTPGQFMMLRFDLPKGPVWRAYSICTPPGSPEVSVTVKRIAGGLVSSHVVERAALGDVLTARGPMGRFVPPEAAQKLFLIAGGSGITPIMSQIRHRLARGDGAKLALLYGNRSEADIIFRAQLDQLSVAHPQLRVQHVLSHGKGELPAHAGILDEATLAQQLKALVPSADAFDAFLMCGPEPMMVAARKALLAHGVPETAILEERFSAATTAAASGEATGEAQMRFCHEGSEQTVTLEAGETLLDAAQRLNLPLDFSCMAGQCGTCVVQLADGDVRMEEPHCLSPGELKSGLVLACVSRPKGLCVIRTVKPKF